MARAGRREVCGQLAVHALAEADQDPCGKPCFGFGQGEPQRVAGAIAERLERARRCLAHDRQRPRVQAPGRARAPQVLAVGVIVRGWPQPAAHLDDRPRRHRGERRQRGGDQHLGAIEGEPEAGNLSPVAR